jgi:hypothetical protein
MQKSLYISLLLVTFLQASDFYNTSSLQGTSGVINTPTAEVLEYESVEFQYSNQVDLENLRDKRDDYSSDQYFINFGFLPKLELIGRLSNIEKKDTSGYTRWKNFEIRDLSASLKYQIPLYHKYLPKVAIGINDLGGQADHYDSKYIVATKDWRFLRGSVGYGFDSINLLDGAFGSLEVRATPWATLLGEYDSKDTQLGLRLNTPKELSDYMDVAFLAKTNLDDTSQRLSFGLNLKMPLGDDHDNLFDFDLSSVDKTVQPSSSDLQTFAQKLVDFGFENVDVGVLDGSLYVAYENNILEHNELDAFGAILGFMSVLDLPYEKFTLVMKKSDTKVKQLTGSLSAYKALMSSPDIQTQSIFRDSLALSRVDDSGVDLSFIGENSSQFKTRVQLSAGFLTFVGTDMGVLDYQVSLRPYATMNLYKGFDIGILGDIPLFNSDELDKDDGAFRRYHKDSEIKSLLLHRSDVLGDFINIASVGTYGDYWAVMDSLSYTHENHTFSLKMDYLEERDKPDWKDDPDIRTNYLGIYSYYIPQIDTNFRLTGGEYFYGDRGYEVRMKKFFGDTAISFFYQNSDQNYIGINIALPLTPRKIADSYLQLKGKNNFNYGLRTTVQDDDGANTIETAYLVKVGREFDTERSFLNRNRLSSDYVKKHILRVRDAGLEYGNW